MNQERLLESFEELVNMVADLDCLRDVVRDMKTELDSLTEKVYSIDNEAILPDTEEIERVVHEVLESVTFHTYID